MTTDMTTTLSRRSVQRLPALLALAATATAFAAGCSAEPSGVADETATEASADALSIPVHTDGWFLQLDGHSTLSPRAIQELVLPNQRHCYSSCFCGLFPRE